MNSPSATKFQQQEDNGQWAEGRALRQQPLAQVGKWEWHLLTKKFVWCAEMYRIFNLSPPQSPLRTGSFFNCVHPEDKERVVRAFGQALVGAQPYQIEHRLVWPDGSVRFVQGQAEVKFDPGGRPVSMFGTVRDITSFRQSEEVSQV
ncbi:MAG: PAS domain-containing protein [Deltaproteobacteria bacterium]|nr:PAS domain-containing protein [Deltaproteobacteria bacterium]